MRSGHAERVGVVQPRGRSPASSCRPAAQEAAAPGDLSEPAEDWWRRGAQSARVDGRFVFAGDAVPERLATWVAAHAREREAHEGELDLVLAREVGADGR